MAPITRPATHNDIPRLTDIWYDGWRESHLDHVPAALAEQRSHKSFGIRLEGMVRDTVVICDQDAVVGFCAIKDNEIYQIYLMPTARQPGVAVMLLSAGEALLKERGVQTARLDVIEQNARAIRFYQKNGWRNPRIETVMLDTLGEPFPLKCMVLEKPL